MIMAKYNVKAKTEHIIPVRISKAHKSKGQIHF